MSNPVEIVVKSTYDGSGVEAGRRDLSQLVQDFKRGSDEMSRAQLDRARAARTGQGTEQSDTALAQKLRQQEQLIPAIRREIIDLQKRRDELVESYLKKGMPQKVLDEPLYRPADLTALDQQIDWAARNAPSLRDEQRLESVAQRQWREEQRKQKADARFKYLIDTSNEDTAREIREESEQAVEDRSQQRRRRVIGAASAVGGMTLFQALRGIGPAEEAAGLRYKIGAPGTRDGLGIDELGKQISEVGRAMHYSRVETLRAADSYSAAAGRMGKELIPEVEQLSRAARFLRMDFSQAGEYFGTLRRLTPDDDPVAMQRIVRTVTGTVRAAGPHGDEMLRAIRQLGERAAQGSPQGLTPETLQIQSAFLRLIDETGQRLKLPGIQGQGAANLAGGMTQFGFNADDMNDVIRYRLLTGTQDQLTGNPFSVQGKARSELERFKRFDIRDEGMVDKYYTFFKKAQQITGAPDAAGQAEGIHKYLPQLSMDNIELLRKEAMSKDGRARFGEILKKVKEEGFTGLEPEQEKTRHMEMQESARKVADALEGLGSAAAYARDKLYGIGGGRFGDYFATAMQGLGGLGGLSMLASRFGYAGPARAARGMIGGAWNLLRSAKGVRAGQFARRVWGAVRMPRTAAATARAAEAARDVARWRPLARAADVLRAVRLPAALRGARGAGAAATFAKVARFAKGAQRIPIVGAAIDVGMTGAVGYTGYKLSQERRAARQSGKSADSMARSVLGERDKEVLERFGGYDDPAMEDEARHFYAFRRGQRRTQTIPHRGYWDRLKLWGKDVTGTDTISEQVTPRAAEEWTEQDMKRRHGLRLPERPDLADDSEFRRQVRLTPETVNSRQDVNLSVKVTVDVTGNPSQREIGQQVGQQVADAVRQEIPDIYEPLSSGWTTNGRLS